MTQGYVTRCYYFVLHLIFALFFASTSHAGILGDITKLLESAAKGLEFEDLKKLEKLADEFKDTEKLLNSDALKGPSKLLADMVTTLKNGEVPDARAIEQAQQAVKQHLDTLSGQQEFLRNNLDAFTADPLLAEQVQNRLAKLEEEIADLSDGSKLLEQELVLYDKEIKEKWLDADLDEPAEFKRLEEADLASTAVLRQDYLKKLDADGRLLYREKMIHQPDLEQIKLGSDPKLAAKSPVILVELGNGNLVVMNGNHRVYKITHLEKEIPLYAIVFSTPQAYEEFFGIKLGRAENGTFGYVDPPLGINPNRPKK